MIVSLFLAEGKFTHVFPSRVAVGVTSVKNKQKIVSGRSKHFEGSEWYLIAKLTSKTFEK